MEVKRMKTLNEYMNGEATVNEASASEIDARLERIKSYLVRNGFDDKTYMLKADKQGPGYLLKVRKIESGAEMDFGPWHVDRMKAKEFVNYLTAIENAFAVLSDKPRF